MDEGFNNFAGEIVDDTGEEDIQKRFFGLKLKPKNVNEANGSVALGRVLQATTVAAITVIAGIVALNPQGLEDKSKVSVITAAFAVKICLLLIGTKLAQLGRDHLEQNTASA